MAFGASDKGVRILTIPVCPYTAAMEIGVLARLFGELGLSV